MKDKLIFNYLNSEAKNMEFLRPANKFRFSFEEGAKINIDGPVDAEYEVLFINNKNQEVVYKSKIKNNMWSSAAPKYFVEWKLQIKKDDEIVAEQIMNLCNKRVKILLDTRSLGDIMAYTGSVVEFQKKHKCIIDCVILDKNLKNSIAEANPTINFYDTDIKDDHYAFYRLGYPLDKWQSYIPVNPKLISLTEVAPRILGLERNEYKTALSYPKLKKPAKPYVCIATQSTCQAKYWNNDGGWEKVIAHINKMGYDVWCIDMFPAFGNAKKKMNYIPKGAIDKTGSLPITERMAQIANSEFFIGLGSGLSWLAWNVGVPVILISGFSEKWAEFFTPYRILNRKVCHACWNDENITFDRNDWMWCPRNKDFECSKSISPDNVIKMIENLFENQKEVNFDWGVQSTANKVLIHEEFFQTDECAYEKFFKVEKGDVVMDVGAHVGAFSYYIADREPSRIIAFEPSKVRFETLKKNLSNFDATLINKAIGDFNGTIPDGLEFDTMVEDFNSMTFDRVIEKLDLQKIDFLKLDCEGGEYDIFTDKNFNWIKNNVKKIAGEWHLHTYEQKKKFYNFRDKYLKEFKDYKVYTIDGIENLQNKLFDDQKMNWYSDVHVYINNQL